jgi:putative hemolysin
MSEILFELVVIGVLLVLNGLFSMSELAIVTAKRVRLERLADRGNSGARAALGIAANPGDFLSTVQVGITLVGVIASVYGGATIAKQLALRLAPVSWIGDRAEAVSLALVVAAITFLSVIMGELVPKRIALGNPERIACLVALPMRLVSRAGAPLVRVLTWSTQVVLRVFGVRGMPEPGLTEEEIHAVIEQGAETGVVPAVEHEIVENVFRLGDRVVGAVMIARPDVPWVDAVATPAEIRATFGDAGRPWLVVCDGDLDRILGIAHAGDLLTQCLDGHAVSLTAILEEPLFVPASTPVFKAMQTLSAHGREVGVVLDEYGGVDGVVSIDHIVSGVLGRRASVEMTAEMPSISATGDGAWAADGGVAMEDVEEALDLPPVGSRSRRGYWTLAGFVMARLGHIAAEGDVVVESGYRFEVQSVDGRRIVRVFISRERK